MNTSTPDPEKIIAELIAEGFTREEAEVLAGHYGDVVEIADDEIQITNEDET
jgi:hypothetical protein